MRNLLERLESIYLSEEEAPEGYVDSSEDFIIREYAFRQVHKGKTVRQAAAFTKKKLAGSPNMFIGGAAKPVFIDEERLALEMWKFYVKEFVKRRNPKSEEDWDGMLPGEEKDWGFIQYVDPKKRAITPKNIKEITMMISRVLGYCPFEKYKCR